MHLSESDFHQIIAESIKSGQPGSLGRAEISTGVVPVAFGASEAPVWYSNPRFGAFLVQGMTESEVGDKSAAGLPTRELLQQCTTLKDVQDTIRGKKTNP
jgi:hypothetical protein